MNSYVYLVPIMGVIGLLYTLWKFAWVSKQDAGTDRMKEIAHYIAEGAMAFLKAEYKILTYYVIFAALLLALSNGSLKSTSTIEEEIAVADTIAGGVISGA